MSRKKLRVHQTDTGNLISNLRGEIGEIIISWVLYKDLMLGIHKIKSPDPSENINNEQKWKYNGRSFSKNAFRNKH